MLPLQNGLNPFDGTTQYSIPNGLGLQDLASNSSVHSNGKRNFCETQPTTQFSVCYTIKHQIALLNLEHIHKSSAYNFPIFCFCKICFRMTMIQLLRQKEENCRRLTRIMITPKKRN